MFSSKLKRSIATMAVIAGVLAAAGPARASSTPLENTMVSGLHQAPGRQLSVGGFKSLGGMDSETEFMDYTDDSLLVYNGHAGLGASELLPDVNDEVLPS